jgi:putative intracellular protease/amidase
LEDAAGAQPPEKLRVGMLVHPDMVLLDLVGPQTVLQLCMAEIHLLWKEKSPVATDVGVPLMPTTTFADCPEALDVLLVPGGLKGSIALMQDRSVLEFLAQKAATARFVTSVCTGGLVLGSAGLLKGYRATAHWYVRDLLALMGATVVNDRVVTDRNRITGGGVTAGIDLGLTIAAELRGEDYARRVQLVLEYAPKPPFDAGDPERAGSVLASDVLRLRSALIESARVQAMEAAKRL